LRSGSGTLESLGQHLSERGRRMFPGEEARLELRYPETWPSVRLSPAARHNVALIGLEALHNAARHSGARNVSLEIGPDSGSRWRLSVRDDGRGGGAVEPTGAVGRLGLESMRRRAERIGAELRFQSGPQGGTDVTLLFEPSAEGRHRRGKRLI